MKLILGSCIGLALFHPGRKLAAMAHIVLPESARRAGRPASLPTPPCRKCWRPWGNKACRFTA